jgi:hypothetical protein
LVSLAGPAFGPAFAAVEQRVGKTTPQSLSLRDGESRRSSQTLLEWIFGANAITLPAQARAIKFKEETW